MLILINTISTKKHAGGAFQIALNFIAKTLEYQEVEWCYVVSSDLDKVLPDAIKNNCNYYSFPTQPDFRNSYYYVKKELSKLEQRLNPDVVYSITAPSYFRFCTKEVMRFTNPWVTHPNKYAWSALTLKEKIFYYIYGLNQKRIIKKAHYFVTQTETCASGIQKITRVPRNNIKVVANVLPAVFKTMDNSPVKVDGYINIACVGAATTHKNFDLIPNVIKELNRLGYSNLHFHITLPDDESTLASIMNKAEKLGVEKLIINHGRLSQKDLGEMYRRCQYCFIPTLLEVFSASTLEAMYFNLPIVATDFPFNKDVLDESALYYEPKNATSAAKKFSELFGNIELQNSLKTKMKERITLYEDYDTHFNSIVEFLKKVATGN